MYEIELLKKEKIIYQCRSLGKLLQYIEKHNENEADLWVKFEGDLMPYKIFAKKFIAS
jgi:hypothetical protein